jgi:hypothetical protein
MLFAVSVAAAFGVIGVSGVDAVPAGATPRRCSRRNISSAGRAAAS